MSKLQELTAELAEVRAKIMAEILSSFKELDTERISFKRVAYLSTQSDLGIDGRMTLNSLLLKDDGELLYITENLDGYPFKISTLVTDDLLTILEQIKTADFYCY